MKFLFLFLFSIRTLANTTYTKDALPIIQNRCALCHNKDMMPDKNWLNYNIAYKAKDKIYQRVWVLKDMPQSNATMMTEDERKVIKNWVEEGAKE